MKIPCILGTLLLSASAITTVAAQSPPAAPTGKTTVTVRSVGTGYQPSGPAPAFSTLDQNGDANLSETEASGYRLLANDFLKADSNGNGSVSKAEYERWAAQP